MVVGTNRGPWVLSGTIGLILNLVTGQGSPTVFDRPDFR
jgi:hypothetical protein